MRALTTLTLLSTLLASPAFAEPLSKPMICERVKTVFKGLAVEKGLSPVLSESYALGATATFIDDMKNQRSSDVISLSALERVVPERSRPGLTGYANTGAIVSQAFGFTKGVTLLLATPELRFLHLAERGVDVVVIAQNAASITQERHAKLVEIAKQLGSKIHILWVGGSPNDDQLTKFEFTLMAQLALQTGGSVTDLSGSGNPCAQTL